MKGKDRCKILKDIRKRIAEENDIEFIVSECKHKGDCLGTCPKCESELRYLERELEKRRKMGKRVAVAGLALSVSLAASSCSADLFSQTTAGVLMPPEKTEEQLKGDLVAPDIGNESSSDLLEEETEIMGVPPLEETEEAVDIPGEIYVEEGELPADGWETTMGETDPDYMDETLMGEPIPDSWIEEETDAPVSEPETLVSEEVETVAETPVVEYETETSVAEDED